MRRRMALVVVTLAALAWLAAILLAPVASSRSPLMTRSAAACYAAGSLICHQRSERSFHFAGAQLPVCARCTGLYAGAALGTLLWVAVAGAGRERRARAEAVARTPRPRRLLIASALPTLLSLSTAALGWWDPGNAIRATLAIPLGAAVGAVVTAVAAGDLR
jgi:hypothetical protein